MGSDFSDGRNNQNNNSQRYQNHHHAHQKQSNNNDFNHDSGKPHQQSHGHHGHS